MGQLHRFYRVLKMPKWAIRLISGDTSGQPCKELFKELQILPLFSLFIFQSLIILKSNSEKYVIRKVVHVFRTERLQDTINCQKWSAFEEWVFQESPDGIRLPSERSQVFWLATSGLTPFPTRGVEARSPLWKPQLAHKTVITLSNIYSLWSKMYNIRQLCWLSDHQTYLKCVLCTQSWVREVELGRVKWK